jgi:hypothetical protein
MQLDLESSARPARLEHATFCLEGIPHKILSAAAGVAYGEGAIHLAPQSHQSRTETMRRPLAGNARKN